LRALTAFLPHQIMRRRQVRASSPWTGRHDMKIRKHPAALIAALSAIALAGSACTDTEESDNAEPSPAMTTSAPTMPAQDDGAMAGPVGAGCADYAEQVPSGPGSIDSMAQEPVATAASNNPLLTTLTSAVSGQL